MKRVIIAMSALIYLSSCQGVAGWFGSSEDSTSNEAKTDVVYRDESITAANAYSDLFLDSNAISSYIQKENLEGEKAQMLRNFYLVRNNQYAWFTTTGLTEQARGLWSLYSSENKGGDQKDSLQQHMDSLVQKDSVSISNSDSTFVHAELALTAKLIEEAGSDSGFVNRNNIYNLVPRKKMSSLELADSILNKQKDTAAFAGNKMYSALKQQLSVYYNAAKNGGWQPISAGSIKKGTSSPAVTALKKRLVLTSDYVTSDTSGLYNDSLATAIKDVQYRFGLQPTGNVNDSLITELNIPAEVRLQQIILNLNRLMWMEPVANGNRVEINIPSQMLYAYSDSGKVFEMPVIVGEEGTGTTVFSGNINQVVFNPSWNVPQSIVRNEILPAMKKDKNYLKNKNMEIVGGSDSLPTIKQLPGKDNALGEVKFLFPNSYDIYLHDTPDKSLFAKKDRTLSHGCIRVANAPQLAAFILKDDWTPEKINTAMHGDKEQNVAVKQAVPVHISYLTAWVDENGKVNFRKDNYGHDKHSMARMFTNNAVNNLATTNNRDSLNKRTSNP